MRIKYHVAADNRLQRSVVEFNVNGTHLGRRIVFLVHPQDGRPTKSLEKPLWQERIHTGDYQNVVDPLREEALEREFLQELIANKDNPAPMQDMNGAWRHDQREVLNKGV